MPQQVNVDRLFDVFQKERYTANPPRTPTDEMVELGAYCVWLGVRFAHQDVTMSEDDWLELWDRMGVSPGDGAEIVATTLSKMPKR